MRPEDAMQAMHFATALSKLKQARDRGEGEHLTTLEVDALIWGIKLLRKGSEDAARTA